MKTVTTAATAVTENLVVSFGHQYGWCVGIVSVFLVLCGWRVTYKNSVKLATRSETKSLIDAISKSINDISDISLSYWLKSTNKKKDYKAKAKIYAFNRVSPGEIAPESVSYLMNILAKANQVYKLIDILQTRGLSIHNSLVSTVIERATLDCETIDGFSREDRAIRAQEVVDSCMLVTKSLYDEFQRCYPPIKSESIISKTKGVILKVKAWNDSIS